MYAGSALACSEGQYRGRLVVSFFKTMTVLSSHIVVKYLLLYHKDVEEKTRKTQKRCFRLSR